MTGDRRPIILVVVPMGDTWGYYWSRVFARPIAAAGGIPLLVSHLEREEDRRAALRRAGGLLLSGGMDIDPRLYGEEPSDVLWELDPMRDEVELPLTREALDEGVPIVGTCRGMQVLNVVLGGTLYLDASHHEGAEDHPSGGYEGFRKMVDADLAGRPVPEDVVRHPVTFTPGSRLAEAYGERALVNSFHHQHVRRLGDGLRATAHADDGVVEGIEGEPGGPPVIGVQWELQEGWNTSLGQFAVFQWLVDAARARETEGVVA